MYARTKKRKLSSVIVLMTILLSLALVPALPAYSQVGRGALAACAKIAFSTEEDFLTQGPEPADGNPIISDGDLLSPNGVVCARNYDLLHDSFDVDQDMGLDAVDVLSVERYLVAFSTELDSPHGNFTAGDLLFTNGAAIPNEILTGKFQLGYDIGLDSVHFVGETDAIVGFATEIAGRGRDEWFRNPDSLAAAFRQWSIDIWFSTEGTPPQGDIAGFLDGDLLSARDGVIVLGNDALLPNTVPAGLPNRGVDFGLDAFTSRTSNPDSVRERGLFSTEILYWPEDASGFTDGDALNVGDGIELSNWDLIGAFEPRAREMGLDALSYGRFGPPPPCYGALTALGGVQAPIANLNPADGMVDLLLYPTRHPFGNDIPFWGHLASCVTKFRVVRRPQGDTGDGTPVLPGPWNVGDPTTWDPMTMSCLGTMPRPVPDAQSYYDAVEFAWLRQCDDSLPLTSWDTYDTATETPLFPDGLYEVRLDYMVGATTHHGPWYQVRLDNTLPEILDLALVVNSGSSGGSVSCPVYTAANMPLTLRGEFADEQFWRFRASIDGDLYPAHTYPLKNYYDVGYLDDTGTIPDGSLVDLHQVSVYDIVPNPVDCCYSVEVTVWDRTIWGRFHGYRAVVSGYIGRWVSDDIYFAFQP
ncbi:MAG TPA: hypothetical protein VM537_30245 [Anaerolineae bacterium]|nr:hypothetical protein [Anaerolineae bacterium]